MKPEQNRIVLLITLAIGVFLSVYLGLGLIVINVDKENILPSESKATTDKESEQIEESEVMQLKITDASGTKHTLEHVEIANTPLEREKGLMFRKSLDNNSGMLFVFDKSQEVGFWMKNTYIPLDMIFIDQNKKIVQISDNAEPLNTNKVYNSGEEVRYVLEVSGGNSAQFGYKIGDNVVFEFE